MTHRKSRFRESNPIVGAPPVSKDSNLASHFTNTDTFVSVLLRRWRDYSI